jgi:Rad3-related DNA helicase
MSDLTNIRNDEAVVSEINTIVSEIKIIKAQTSKILLNSAMEIGKRLKEAKELVGHGNWEKWLEEKVEYSQRTATNLMRLYEEYSVKKGDNLNRKLVADLGYTQAIAMLKLDFEDRENFVVENEVEEMSVKELEEAIKEKIALKEEKETLKSQLEEQTEKESQLAKELQEKIEKIEDYERLVKENAEEKKQLKELIESQEQHEEENQEKIDPEELEKLKEEAEKRKKEIKELKKQLKEKPKEIEVEVEKIIETIPEGLQEELNSLKAKLEQTNSKLHSSESIAKFKSTFGLLVNFFNDLLATLDDIEKEEPEEYEKYKAAVNKFLEKLMIKE